MNAKKLYDMYMSRSKRQGGEHSLPPRYKHWSSNAKKFRDLSLFYHLHTHRNTNTQTSRKGQNMRACVSAHVCCRLAENVVKGGNMRYKVCIHYTHTQITCDSIGKMLVKVHLAQHEYSLRACVLFNIPEKTCSTLAAMMCRN